MCLLLPGIALKRGRNQVSIVRRLFRGGRGTGDSPACPRELDGLGDDMPQNICSDDVTLSHLIGPFPVRKLAKMFRNHANESTLD